MKILLFCLAFIPVFRALCQSTGDTTYIVYRIQDSNRPGRLFEIEGILTASGKSGTFEKQWLLGDLGPKVKAKSQSWTLNKNRDKLKVTIGPETFEASIVHDSLPNKCCDKEIELLLVPARKGINILPMDGYWQYHSVFEHSRILFIHTLFKDSTLTKPAKSNNRGTLILRQSGFYSEVLQQGFATFNKSKIGTIIFFSDLTLVQPIKRIDEDNYLVDSYFVNLYPGALIRSSGSLTRLKKPSLDSLVKLNKALRGEWILKEGYSINDSTLAHEQLKGSLSLTFTETSLIYKRVDRGDQTEIVESLHFAIGKTGGFLDLQDGTDPYVPLIAFEIINKIEAVFYIKEFKDNRVLHDRPLEMCLRMIKN